MGVFQTFPGPLFPPLKFIHQNRGTRYYPEFTYITKIHEDEDELKHCKEEETGGGTSQLVG